MTVGLAGLPVAVRLEGLLGTKRYPPATVAPTHERKQRERPRIFAGQFETNSDLFEISVSAGASQHFVLLGHWGVLHILIYDLFTYGVRNSQLTSHEPRKQRGRQEIVEVLLGASRIPVLLLALSPFLCLRS